MRLPCEGGFPAPRKRLSWGTKAAFVKTSKYGCRNAKLRIIREIIAICREIYGYL